MAYRLADLHGQIGPQTVQHVIDTLLFYLPGHAAYGCQAPFIKLVRQLVQKVEIGKTPGHQPATLEVHGRIASILAAMEATTILETGFKLLKHHDYLTRIAAGELDTGLKRKRLHE